MIAAWARIGVVIIECAVQLWWEWSEQVLRGAECRKRKKTLGALGAAVKT